MTMTPGWLAEVETIAVCVPDNAGRLIGKRVSARRWPDVVAHGLPMPDFHLVTGLENVPLEGLEVTGAHTGFGNGLLVPDPQTLRRVPWDLTTALVLSDAHRPDGSPFNEAPRAVLRGQLDRLADRGLQADMASELEFYLYAASYREAFASGYARLSPVYHRHGDHDILVAGYAEPFLGELRRAMSALGADPEASQGEGSPGQHEINFPHGHPLAVADQHVLFKHAAKALAHQHGLAVTFMAKVATDQAGSSCHVHLSLRDAQGAPLASDGGGGGGGELVPLERAFLAGVMRHAPDFMVLHAPYVNSYRRLQPDSWAPTKPTWGRDNRSCMVRVLGTGDSRRIEYRLPGADCNPYLSFAGLLAAGIEGVDRQLEVPAPTNGNAYVAAAEDLPGDLTEAAARFRASQVAQDALGVAVHRHLAALAEHERDAARAEVTGWELRRGFEPA